MRAVHRRAVLLQAAAALEQAVYAVDITTPYELIAYCFVCSLTLFVSRSSSLYRGWRLAPFNK